MSWRRWLWLLVLLLAFGLRAFALDLHSLRGDEAISATYSALPLAEMLEISRVDEPHPPLFYFLLGLWERLAGMSEYAVRFWALWPGLLSVALLRPLLRRLGAAEAALPAAAFLAFNSFHIWHSQDARSYTWLVMAGLLASIVLLDALSSQPHHPTRSAWRPWFRYGLSVAFLVWLHYYALFILVAHGLYVLWRVRLQAAFWRWLVAVTLGGVTLLPWLWISWQFILGYTGNFEPAAPVTIIWRGLQAFSGGPVSDAAVTFAPWMLLAAGLAALGLFVAGRRQPQAALFLSLYLALTFLGVIGLTLRGQAFTERYLIGALPAYAALVGLGWAWLWRQQRWGAALGGPLALALLAWNGLVWHSYLYDEQLAKSPEWREAFDLVFTEQDAATDALIYNLPEASITYYLDTYRPPDQTGWIPSYFVPRQPQPDPVALEAELAALSQRHERIWLVQGLNSQWYDQGLVEQYFTRYSDRVTEANYRWVKVHLYHTPPRLAADMRRLNRRFEHGLQLEGYQLFADEEAGRVQLERGDSLKLSLYWTSDGPTERPYTVFTQLIDASGMLRAGYDNQPVWNTYPTTAWQPNERIVDKYRLRVPDDAPTVPYQLWVGLYDSETGQRLQWLDKSGKPQGDYVVLDIVIEVGE